MSRTKQRSSRWPNFFASLVLTGAIGLTYFNCDPMVAGSDPTARVASLNMQPSLELPSLPNIPVPAPVEPGAAADPSDQDSQTAQHDPAVLQGRWALQMNIALLERGIEKLKHINDYKCTFSRQERVGGALLDPQVMKVKIRHEPFSVYLKWIVGDKGRQAIYVQGLHDGKLLVQPGGFKGRLTGTLPLDPTDSLVMAESRHPVTEFGILKLATKIAKHQKQDLERGTGYRCQMYDNQVLDERPCFLFVLEYDSPEICKAYRKSAIFIDKELSLPVGIRNYTWGIDVDPEKIDEETIVESYTYSDIEFNSNLAMEDFSAKNPKYRMRYK